MFFVPDCRLNSDLPSAPVMASSPTDAGSGQFALWVAFFEIYNESVYDLLQPSFCSKSKKRASLRVCDDGAGNAYVKGLFGEFGGGRRRCRCSHVATAMVCVCRPEVDQHPEPGRSFKTASVREQKQKRRSYKDEPVLQQEASLGVFGSRLVVLCVNLTPVDLPATAYLP